jgi:hypothetical protein
MSDFNDFMIEFYYLFHDHPFLFLAALLVFLGIVAFYNEHTYKIGKDEGYERMVIKFDD